MRVFFILLFVMLSITAPNTSLARPVSYSDTLGLISLARPNFAEFGINYTFTQRAAAGLDYYYVEDKSNLEHQLVLFRLNLLGHRWLRENYQANIYLSGGIGFADNSQDTDLAYAGILNADFETRRIFVSGSARILRGDDIPEFDTLQNRVGFAPYLAGFNDLQTWFMVQTTYFRNLNREISITPLLRFFYKNVLWEIGSSLRSEWLLQVTIEI